MQLFILSSVELQTLQNLTQAIPSALELYLKYPSSILRSVLASHEPQIRNFLLITFSLICTIKYPDIYPKLNLDNMEDFLAEHLDPVSPRKIESLEYDPLSALHELCSLDADIASLVLDYAQLVYKQACQHSSKPGLTNPPPLILSPIEFHRISRAIYRLKLFGLLFHYTPHCTNIHPATPLLYKPFFSRLSTFELDELVSAYQFVCGDRRYVKFVHPLGSCTCHHGKPWRFEYLWNHSPSCELFSGHVGIEKRRVLRSSEAFYYTLVGQSLLHDRGGWARQDICRSSVVKHWSGVEANGPSEGWLRWRKIRNDTTWTAKRHDYSRLFSELGYCFWDEDRVKDWGNMFTKEWYHEELEKARPGDMACLDAHAAASAAH